MMKKCIKAALMAFSIFGFIIFICIVNKWLTDRRNMAKDIKIAENSLKEKPKKAGKNAMTLDELANTIVKNLEKIEKSNNASKNFSYIPLKQGMKTEEITDLLDQFVKTHPELDVIQIIPDRNDSYFMGFWIYHKKKILNPKNQKPRK